jgi:hypothetical protein
MHLLLTWDPRSLIQMSRLRKKDRAAIHYLDG